MELESVVVKDVGTAEDAAEFVRACCREIGLGFHPDTPFSDYVEFNRNDVRENRDMFPPDDAARLDGCMKRAFLLLGEGVYDVGLAEFAEMTKGKGAKL